ncbi:MAG: type II toxin-antitoxin system ParD family antitoxin [Thermomicrobiales bacterium]
MMRQLTRDQQALVEQIVATSQYDDADKANDEALRLLEERERRLQWLRAELAIGEEQERRGDVVVYTPDFMDRLIDEGDELDRLGEPIKDAVKPKSHICA